MATGINTSITTFSTALTRYVPSAPSFIKDREIRLAIADFCKTTRAWRATIEDVTISAGDMWIDANRLARRVSPDALAYAVDDIMLTADKTPLRRLSIEDMDRNVSGWLSHVADEPTGFMLYNDRRARLYPAMDDGVADVDATVELILIPNSTITLIPDFIWDFHLDAILYKAAHRIASMPDMPFTNMDHATFYLAMAGKDTQEGLEESAKRAVDSVNDRNRRKFFYQGR